VEERPVPEGSDVLRDEVILLTSQEQVGPEARLRRIEVWVEEKQETLVFVTNNLRLAARNDCPDLQRALADRTLLQGLKQGLKVKTSSAPARTRCRFRSGPRCRHAGAEVPATEEHVRLEPV